MAGKITERFQVTLAVDEDGIVWCDNDANDAAYRALVMFAEESKYAASPGLGSVAELVKAARDTKRLADSAYQAGPYNAEWNAALDALEAALAPFTREASGDESS